jgi:glucokinase
LIGDIGGTNARFALASQDSPRYAKELLLPCADFESAHLAIDHFLKKTRAGSPKILCLAAAGPVVAQKVRFTNNRWSLDAKDLASTYAGARVRLLNDFEAIAHSIPFLGPADCLHIGLPEAGALPADQYTVGIIGPGTGLGAVGLKRIDNVNVPIAGEAGHIGFSPATQVQIEVLTVLRQRFDRVSSEPAVSALPYRQRYSQ